jgi:hypothetical protein
MIVVSAGVSRETPWGKHHCNFPRFQFRKPGNPAQLSPDRLHGAWPVRVAFHVKHMQACCGWRAPGYVGVQPPGLCAASPWLTAVPEPYRHHAELNGRLDASMWHIRGGVIRGGPSADRSDATVYAQHYRA